MDDLNLSMFRAYDIRTSAARLPDELAVRLARAEAVYFHDILRVPGVLVAHDARRTGPHYLEIAADVYRRAGLDVKLLPGVCSTSAFYFAAMCQPQLAGVLLGASHNPAADTGRKILGPGVRPIAAGIGPQGGLDCIRTLYLDNAMPRSGTGQITACDPTDAYIAYSMDLAGVQPDGLKGLKVLQDYLNGAAGREMMLAFQYAGADLQPLHFTADGDFPLGDPNPVKQDVVRAGIAALRTSGALLGTFFDGDGDRIDFYRGDGHYLSSSFVYAGILPSIRGRFDGAGWGVYADLKSNPLAVAAMAKTGVSIRIIRNGHSQIKHAMFEDPTRFGTVEESGHFYEAFSLDGRRYCTENTLYIALLVARVWSEAPERFDALFELQSHTSRQREWGHRFRTNHERTAALDAVECHFAAHGAQAMKRAPDGYDLEATIMRRGLPFEIDAGTRPDPEWLQVCQRISQSEDGLARWEVVAARPEVAAAAKQQILDITRRHGGSAEYQG